MHRESIQRNWKSRLRAKVTASWKVLGRSWKGIRLRRWGRVVVVVVLRGWNPPQQWLRQAYLPGILLVSRRTTSSLLGQALRSRIRSGRKPETGGSGLEHRIWCCCIHVVNHFTAFRK